MLIRCQVIHMNYGILVYEKIPKQESTLRQYQLLLDISNTILSWNKARACVSQYNCTKMCICNLIVLKPVNRKQALFHNRI